MRIKMSSYEIPDESLEIRNPIMNYYYVLFFVDSLNTTMSADMEICKFVVVKKSDIRKILVRHLGLEDENDLSLITISKI